MFWAASFWADTFWATGFWQGMTTPTSPGGHGDRKRLRLLKIIRKGG